MEKVNRLNKMFINAALIKIDIVIALLVFFMLSACQNTPFIDDSWKVKMKDLGFSSSPRIVDLNGDQVMDIVVGGSGPEFVATKYGVVAFDGANGEVIWKVPSRNQIFGSPIFQDINEDGTSDIFIGGRSAVFYALNGKNGDKLWEYLPDNDSLDLVEDPSLLNFYNPQWIDDVDDDNKKDILITFGGFVKAAPHELSRPAGRIMVISGKTGKVLHDKPIHDGKETYMSPLIYQADSISEKWIIFGTGGETIGGGLYKASLSTLIEKDSLIVNTLAIDNTKGFIAPPVIIDVNQDNIKDLVACSVQGNVICFDGKTDKIIWENKQANNFEVYATPCPGFYVGNDQTPDFFLSMGFSPKSNKKYSVQVLINGEDGKIVNIDTLGLFSYSSPVSYGFSGKNEEILISLNEYRPIPGSGFSASFYTNRLVVYNPKNTTINNLRPLKIGTNLGATPLITDLDNDGWIDIIYGYMADGEDFYSYQNGVFERIELKIKFNPEAPWVEYMGEGGKGIY